jgi:RimJ/RimL family protein N-acetyltransferase
MEMKLAACAVRSWRTDDAASLARHANDRRVSIHLRDLFPFPYGEHDAREFIERARSQDPERNFAIDVDGFAVGGIGFTMFDDVERTSTEIGYWLGAAFWGRGIATEAVTAITDFIFLRYPVTRVFAVPFAPNVASARVLEKAGYELEGRLRRSAIKQGRVLDQLIYARIRPD